MSQFPRLWLGLTLLVVVHSEEVQIHGRNVCPHAALVTYKKSVYKSKLVPYQEHNFFQGWHTKYRTQYGWEDVVDYKMGTKYSCCQGYEGSADNCQPVCSAGCPSNSFCAAPNQCRCNEGAAETDCQDTTWEAMVNGKRDDVTPTVVAKAVFVIVKILVVVSISAIFVGAKKMCRRCTCRRNDESTEGIYENTQ